MAIVMNSSKSIFLLSVLFLCSACENETKLESEKVSNDFTKSQEYKAEEVLKMIEANPSGGGMIVTPWDTPPQLVHAPKIPPDLDKDGEVGMWMSVTVDGIVDTAWVIRSSGSPDLDSLALYITRKTVLTPAKKDGKPIAVAFPFPFVFRADLPTYEE